MTILKGLHRRLRNLKRLLSKFTFASRERTPLHGQTSQSRPEPSKGKLYTTCYELPLVNFIHCLVEEDYRWLLRDETDKYDPEAAKRAWEAIYIEYLELIGNDEFGYLIKINLEIQSLQSLIIATDIAINSLYKNKDEKLIKILLEVGYKVELMAGWDAYFKSLDRIRKHLSALSIEHKRKLAEFEQLKKGYKAGRITMEYFEDLLIILTKYMGFHVKKSDLTTAEFCRMLKQYNKEAEKWQEKAR